MFRSSLSLFIFCLLTLLITERGVLWICVFLHLVLSGFGSKTNTSSIFMVLCGCQDTPSQLWYPGQYDYFYFGGAKIEEELVICLLGLRSNLLTFLFCIARHPDLPKVGMGLKSRGQKERSDSLSLSALGSIPSDRRVSPVVWIPQIPSSMILFPQGCHSSPCPSTSRVVVVSGLHLISGSPHVHCLTCILTLQHYSQCHQ